MNLNQTKYIAPAAMVLGGVVAVVSAMTISTAMPGVGFDPSSRTYLPIAVVAFVLGLASFILGVIALARK